MNTGKKKWPIPAEEIFLVRQYHPGRQCGMGIMENKDKTTIHNQMLTPKKISQSRNVGL